MASSKANVSYDLLTKEEDLARFKAATIRLAERIRTDKDFARQFLRETGYFELMKLESQETKSPAT